MKRLVCRLRGHQFYHLDSVRLCDCKRCGLPNFRWYWTQHALRVIGGAVRNDRP